MAMVTLTSDHLSGALSSENSHHLLEASFSSCINCSEGRFVLQPAEKSRSPNSTISMQHPHLGRNKVEDGEISVFGAEKYFSGRIDEENPGIKTNDEINSHIDEKAYNTGPVKPKIQGRTPSVHSESSWNSQSALMLNVLRNPPRRKANKSQGRNLLASLGCNCSCLGKKSVDIDEHVGYQINSKGRSGCGAVRTQTVATKEHMVQNGLGTVDVAQTNKSRLDNPWLAEEMSCKKIEEVGLGLKREDYLSFPILKSKLGNLAVKLRLEEKENDDDKQRKSLEVFGSPVLQKKKKSFSLERRFTMLEEAEIPGMYTNDTASDASSDLFEIESFTNNSTSNSNNPFLQRQGSDGMSSCVTQTTHYAPSEASIEWSVVTASAADFSVVSDSEDPISSSSAKPQRTAPNAKCNELEKRHSGIMLGCNSQKAVRVAEDAYRTNGKAFPEQPRRHHRSECFLPGTRFQTKTTRF